MSARSLSIFLIALVQRVVAFRHRVVTFKDGGCAPLRNEGSFSTVEVSVGTPSQKMHLVADTGSDVVLVEDCACEDLGSCKKDGHCFRGGKGKSSTFHLKSHPDEVTITYGSGPIDTVVATDMVKLGGVSVNMEDSLMLITNNRLEGGLQLEGILGLGMPKTSKSKEKGFLDAAKLSRFSMCFNNDGKTGVLHLGSSTSMDRALGSVGQAHWGVDFRGITVGDSAHTGAVSICDESSMKAGQKTPCGAIVDSGTTLIMAPKEHLTKLVAQICDAWPKCKDNEQLKEAGAGKESLLSMVGKEAVEQLQRSKAKLLFGMASDCDLASMPSLHFHVRGAGGDTESLELSPQDYMIETSEELVDENLFGWKESRKVCRLAFATHDYDTKENGPVWILGTPFFYKYSIGYDRASSPPSISFGRGGCTSCGGSGGASLFAHQQHKPRSLSSAPRVSYINVSMPL